jgi:menaquinone-dependent protoporphyrinogen oxidase
MTRKKKILVVYASRHGSTRGIAERIGTVLRSEHLSVTVAPVEDRPDPSSFEAVVLGSAAYFGAWLSEAKSFIRRHRKALRERPVWLFSSGPVEPPTPESKGAALLPKTTNELKAILEPRGHEIFQGAFDPANRPKSIGERIMRLMPASRDLLPAGDFRDWPAIDAYARRIAAELAAPRET